ncbi:MAG: MFS transporter [Sulfobacillus thermosulfidooxidans]|uniref:MFS transporter n=1 Tax=Sulfobacillus thermotolerans TaxID=338644 RepID=A0ABM6RR22_9FIRM|nr:MFS transporter [Sulfobacillus sp. hq2]AUW93820.1 MFS transporter [Sulfobacillus thermotolerans]MCY0908752.1 MFS transporter [Sulfobacillus thermotolerans]POB11367.1 MFS transporter [Sulfobacillus sp. hq2]PSR36282.1 MAG: MFS transporter [Sulfobacillus thermosulfidooxidans]
MTQPPVTGEEHWTRTDTWSFWAFGLGMLLEAYIFGMATIATGWTHMPPDLRSLLLSWAPLWLIIGIAVAGPLSDRVGRKNTFYLTMSLYGIGAIGIVFSYSYVLILLFLAVLLFAAGGEMNTIMAASHEMMPTKHRGKTMMMELNFINLGGFLLALVALMSAYNSVSFQRGMIAITILVVLFVLFLARNRTPESIRWLEQRGLTERAKAEAAKYYGEDEYQVRQNLLRREQDQHAAPKTSMGVRFYATTATAFAGSAGFGLMTYVLGPSYFKNDTALILLVATGVGFFSGFLGLLADRWSRKTMLLWGYGGTFLVTLIIYLSVDAWTKTAALFWLLLVVLNFFVNIGYLTEDTLKGEVWPTKKRGTYTAIVRFVSIGLYIVTIYMSQNYDLHQYMLFNLVVWAIGLSGALLWVWKGNETGRGVSLETASGEE